MRGRWQFAFLGVFSVLVGAGMLFLLLIDEQAPDRALESPPARHAAPKAPEPLVEAARPAPIPVPAPEVRPASSPHTEEAPAYLAFQSDGRALIEGNCTVAGTVVDETGKPLPGMTIVGGTGLSLFPGAVSDENGRFRAEKVPPGNYKLAALPPGTTGSRIYSENEPFTLNSGEKITDLRIVYDVSSEYIITGRVTNTSGMAVEGAQVKGSALASASHASTITGPDGRYALPLRHAQVTVTHPDYSVQEAVWAKGGDRDVDFILRQRGRIEGHVVDARTGEPLTNFEVGAKLTSIRSASVKYVPVSDDDGRFVLDDVDAGEVNVYVRADGYALGRSDAIDVKPGAVTRRLLTRMGKGATLRGQVVSMDGAPVSGAQFRLKNPYDWAMMPPVISQGSDTITVQSGIDGAFIIEGLDPGFTKITAVHAEYPDTTVPLELAVGQITTLKIVMTGLATVEGTVYANGEPALKGSVSVDAESLKVSKSGEVGENGFYRITDVPEGEVTVRATVNAGGSHRSSAAAAWTTLGHTTEVDLEVHYGTSAIEGRVTRNGEALVMASISASAVEGDDQAGTMTASDGNYRISGLFGGEYRLHVVDVLSGEPKPLGSAQTSVEPGETAIMDINIESEISENTQIEQPRD